MHIQRQRCPLLTGVIALVLAGGTAAAAVIPEAESNNTKVTANSFTLASGDTITGSCQNAATNADYFKITSSALSSAIYLNTLTSSNASTGLSIRGTNLAGTGDSDFTSSGQGRQTVKWYGFGKSEFANVRIANASSTSSTVNSYTLTYTTTAVTPANAGTFNQGLHTFEAAGLSDTEVYLYDASFNLIGQNDNRSATDVRGLVSFNFTTNGTYYIAIGKLDSATNNAGNTTSGSPFFEGGGSSSRAVLLDSPDIVAGRDTFPSSNDYGIKVDGGTSVLPGATVQALELGWFSITVIPAPGSAAMLGLGGLLAMRRRRLG